MAATPREPADGVPRQELILDAARRRTGERRPLPPGDPVEAVAWSRTCADRFAVRAAIEGERITAVAWEGRGCAVSTASATMLAELAPGRSPDELAALLGRLERIIAGEVGLLGEDELSRDLEAFSGLGRVPLRARCATLVWRALVEAL